MRALYFIGLLGLLFFLGTGMQAQPPQADEPDTEAFLVQNFLLQSEYTGVRCVSADGGCPSEIEVVVPCLIAVCSRQPERYPIEATYDTIQAAADAAQPGELIVITPGRYAGVIVEETGGDDRAYIHFLGLGEPGDVVVDRVADPSLRWLRHHFYFIDTHHYIIQNITFTNAPNGSGIFFSGFFNFTGAFSHHMIVMDVYSHDNFKWGMHTTAASYLIIQDSVFTNSDDEHGLYISGSGDHVLIRRNIFQGNNAAGVQVNADPQTATAEVFYWLQNTTGDTCGWGEADVEFTGAARWDDLKTCYDQQRLPDLGELIEDGISEKIIIEGNIITGNGRGGGAGINLASARNSVVRNNLIYGNDAAGIACWDNAYASDKGLASSEFGCQNVLIANNTLIDRDGNRGSLIITNDAQNMRIHNNIIIRDRFDAYEISTNSGMGLQSGNNYYSAQYIDQSPGFNGDRDSITGFTVAEGLANFVNPNFEPWVLEDEDGYTRNPTRPNYHLLPSSPLTTVANPDAMSLLDLSGNLFVNEIGAFALAQGS